MGRGPGPQPLVDLLRSRRHAGFSGEDGLQPVQQPLRVGRARGQRGHRNEVVVSKVVEDPFRAVGEDPDIAAPVQGRAVYHVSGQLDLSVPTDPSRTKVLLDLDHAVPDRNVEAPSGAIPRGHLQADHLIWLQVQPAGEQGVDVSLHVGFRSDGVSRHQPSNDVPCTCSGQPRTSPA